MPRRHLSRLARLTTAAVTAAAALALPAGLTAGAHADDSGCPWMDASLSPAARTAKLLPAMTLDDKIQMVTGVGLDGVGPRAAENPNPGAAGAILGNARLCIP